MVSLGANVALYLFPCLMLVAGVIDVLSLRIPNWIVTALAVLFVPFAIMSGIPPFALGLHVATGIVLLFTGFGLFSMGIIGGGDAKLMAVAGLWLGFPVVLPFLLFSALAGGVLAAAIGLWAAAGIEARLHSAHLDRAVSRLAPNLPYGFALAAGAILATPYSWWMGIASA